MDAQDGKPKVKRYKCECILCHTVFIVSINTDAVPYDPWKHQCCPTCGSERFHIYTTPVTPVDGE